MFEDGRVSLGAQNRQEEAPIKGKQRLERRGRNNKRKNHTSMARKGQKKKCLVNKFLKKSRFENLYRPTTRIPAYLRVIQTRRSESLANMQSRAPAGRKEGG